MFVVTFYSYKGGVGRTMALANTAVALARAGRRVLVVDFDLEAPGLPSYPHFACARDCPGMVDYINTYRRTNIAPAAADYIVPCEYEGATVWVMPAGLHTSDAYAADFASIDWDDLYANRSGYLLFEDLKQQWDSFEGTGFDYVLIDSRTGHTDVGGICTRQLPDAVVIMFLPTEQNVSGLVPIVDAIREERDPDNEAKINLLFCPSNVPDLDDYEGILCKLMDKARKALRYDSTAGEQQPVAVIHNYSSLHLLKLEAFALARPNSRLAREYDQLRTAIISRNYGDPEGAVAALGSAIESLSNARGNKSDRVFENAEKTADKVRQARPKDPQVAMMLAQIYGELERSDAQIAALSVAIEQGFQVARALLERARARLKLDLKEEAVQDLKSVLTTPSASPSELHPAARILQGLDVDWSAGLQSVLERDDLTSRFKAIIAHTGMTQRLTLPVVAAGMSRMLATKGLPEEAKSAAHNNLVMSLIGAGRFKEAMEGIVKERRDILHLGAAHSLFNYAMAEWGATDVLPQDLFTAFVRMVEDWDFIRDANVFQCRAIASWAAGDHAGAMRMLDAAAGATPLAGQPFSCWRYLYVSTEEMLADLDDMRALLEAGLQLKPPFFESERTLI